MYFTTLSPDSFAKLSKQCWCVKQQYLITVSIYHFNKNYFRSIYHTLRQSSSMFFLYFRHFTYYVCHSIGSFNQSRFNNRILCSFTFSFITWNKFICNWSISKCLTYCNILMYNLRIIIYEMIWKVIRNNSNWSDFNAFFIIIILLF